MMFLFGCSLCIILLCIIGLFREHRHLTLLNNIASLCDTYNIFTLGIIYEKNPYQFYELLISAFYVFLGYIAFSFLITLSEEQDKKTYLLLTLLVAIHTMVYLSSPQEMTTELILYV
jgi:hypothetical protein